MISLRYLAAMVCVAVLESCGAPEAAKTESDTAEGGACVSTPGTEGCPCFEGACIGDLACLSELCVRRPAEEAGDASGGTTMGGETSGAGSSGGPDETSSSNGTSGPASTGDVGSTSGGDDDDPGSTPGDTLVGRSRREFCAYFVTEYVDRSSAPWVAGSEPNQCLAGVLHSDVIEDFVGRVNFYRGLYDMLPVGSPHPIVNARAQECAMMMAVAQDLSHTPDTSWPCYSATGAQAAGESDLGLAGTPGRLVDGMVTDFGPDQRLGHRRWTLFPPMAGPGYGFYDPGKTSPGGCQVVFADEVAVLPRTSDEPRPYPPPGYFHETLATDLPFEGYEVDWSLSWERASFTEATVEMTDLVTGDSIPLAEPLTERDPGYGDPTAGWRAATIPRAGDAWQVRIEGVTRDDLGVDPIVYTVKLTDCSSG